MKTNKQSLLKKNINWGDITLEDLILISFLLLIGLAEAVHLVAVMLGKNLSFITDLFVAGFFLVVVVMISIGFFWSRAKKPQRRIVGAPVFVAGILMLLSLVSVLMGESVYIDGDMTLESVNSFLVTDAVYQVNPLTGVPYELGMPLRLKILCLPTLYSVLAALLPVGAEYLVYHLVPAVVLICSYLAYWNLSGGLFGEEKAGCKKRASFMILVVLLFWVGNYAYGMDGFGALYCGYRGVSIRALVLLPYVFSLALRKKWITACLCILAEACIVWTFYGMGACLFVVVCLWLTEHFLLLRDQRDDRKENTTC